MQLAYWVRALLLAGGIFTAAGSAALGQSTWHKFEEGYISGKVSGRVSRGTLFRTNSGTLYQVDEDVTHYPSLYSPRVTVLSEGLTYRLLIEGIEQPITCRRIRPRGVVGTGTSGSFRVIEPRIDDNFDGLEWGRLYKLQNGQVWEQTEHVTHLRMTMFPSVLLYRTDSGYKMVVSGLDSPVGVRPVW
ncbi:MAG: hypothetical protein VKO21_04645 [Candidatus Sericytochromatia bacterium]|nr:hypothetical protein [Candidatus Sericytochromatia bacterium]